MLHFQFHILKNTLIQWISLEDERPKTERILWVSPDHIYVYTMDVDNPHIPNHKFLDELHAAYLDGKLIILAEDLIVEHELLLEAELTSKQKAHIQKIWPIIEEVTEAENGEGVFITESRQRLLNKHPINSNKIMRHLFNFWRLGQVPVALAPRYDRRGRGSSISKDGNTNSAGRYPDKSFPLNPHNLKLMKMGYDYYYASGRVLSVSDAHQKTLEKYFNIGYLEKNGVYIPIIPDKGKCPSYEQFLRHCHYSRDREKVFSKREGAAYTQNSISPHLGSANQMAVGPGSYSFLDSTSGDANTVSSFNRSFSLGKLTVYHSIDLFSGMITGYSLTLEEPSWLAQSLALVNMLEDKVAYCKQYDIHIEESDWPCHHLPQIILGDCGELKSSQATNLIMNFNVTVINNPAWRPFMKNMAEASFHFDNIYNFHKLPGGGPAKERGKRDQRGAPILIPYELHQAEIQHILLVNKSRIKEEYAFDADQIADMVEPTALSLWNWGIKNRSGILRTVPFLLAYRSLLPRQKGSITHKGVVFKGRRYDVAEKNFHEEARSWYVKARKKSQSVDIAYDHRDMSRIYICLPDRRFIQCQLLERERAYWGKTWWESDQIQRKSAKQKEKLDQQWKQSLAYMHAQIEVIIADAEEAAEIDREQSNARKSDLFKNLQLIRLMEKTLTRMMQMLRIHQLEDMEEEEMMPIREVGSDELTLDYSEIISSAISEIIEEGSDDEER